MSTRPVQRGLRVERERADSRMTQNSQHLHAEGIVALVHQIPGLFPGYPTLRPDGRLYRGVFRGEDVYRRRIACGSHWRSRFWPVS